MIRTTSVRGAGGLPILALLGSALAGCIPGQVNVETPMLVAREGVLHGDRPDVPCVWISETNGEQTYLELPPDWSVSANPLVVHGGDGDELAREGEFVRVESLEGFSSAGETTCGPGVPIEVTGLIRLN